MSVRKLGLGALAALAFAVGVGVSGGAVAAGRPDCLYPSIRVWLTGGNLTVAEGRFFSYPCPSGKPQHRLIVVKQHGGRLLIKMAPSN
jgi:hypothetical protein